MKPEKTFADRMRESGICPRAENEPTRPREDHSEVAAAIQPVDRPVVASRTADVQRDFLQVDQDGNVVLPSDDAAILEMLLESIERHDAADKWHPALLRMAYRWRPVTARRARRRARVDVSGEERAAAFAGRNGR